MTDNVKNLFFVRLQYIEFTDFRNIESGRIELPNAEIEQYIGNNPSLLGLYGQNGSGKSSVIMALGILKDLLTGNVLDKKYLSCVRYGCDSCKLSFSFALYSKLIDEQGKPMLNEKDSTCFYVDYDVEISLVDEDSYEADNVAAQAMKKLRIENEVFKYRVTDSGGTVLVSKQSIIDTTSREGGKRSLIFGSKQKEQWFTLNNSETLIKYRNVLAVTSEKSQSFVFSPKTISLLEETCEKFIQTNNDFEKMSQTLTEADSLNNAIVSITHNKELTSMFYVIFYMSTPIFLIRNLRDYGKNYLHVIDTVTTGLTNINTHMPLLLWRHEPGQQVYNEAISLNMNEPTSIPEKDFASFIQSLNAVGIVLNRIVPGIDLSFKDLGIKLANNSEERHYFEIMSRREKTVIPLRYESDGLRRIISILSLLIAVYNDASFTIAIDEIDSGIFEYLLGEILSIMSDSVRGQLIFTSHNLRPLEVVPAKYLCFTTTNPDKRFVKLPNRGNSNLRDTYFRSIILNTQKEQVYNPTDRHEIEMAFYQAGHEEVTDYE